MHLFCLRRAFLLTSFLVALPGAALAQGDWNQPWSDPRDRPPRVDLSLSGGYDMASDWSSLTLLGTSSPATGVVEQVRGFGQHECSLFERLAMTLRQYRDYFAGFNNA